MNLYCDCRVDGQADGLHRETGRGAARAIRLAHKYAQFSLLWVRHSLSAGWLRSRCPAADLACVDCTDVLSLPVSRFICDHLLPASWLGVDSSACSGLLACYLPQRSLWRRCGRATTARRRAKCAASSSRSSTDDTTADRGASGLGWSLRSLVRSRQACARSLRCAVLPLRCAVLPLAHALHRIESLISC